MHCSHMNYKISCVLPEVLKVECDVGWDFSLWIYLTDYSLLLKYLHAYLNKMTSSVHPLSVKGNQKELFFFILNWTFPMSSSIWALKFKCSTAENTGSLHTTKQVKILRKTFLKLMLVSSFPIISKFSSHGIIGFHLSFTDMPSLFPLEKKKTLKWNIKCQKLII